MELEDAEGSGMDGYQLGSLSFFLRHSANRPLSLSINLESDFNCLPKILLKECNRIQRLYINSSVPVPNTINSLMKGFQERGGNALVDITVNLPLVRLDEIHTSGYTEAFSLSQTPHLATLYLPNVISVELDALQTLWHLKSIEISQFMSVNQCLVLLDLAPAVDTLSLRLGRFQDEDFSDDDELELDGIKPEYSMLRTLHVRSQEALDLGQLLSSVALPGLRSFSFTVDGGRNWASHLKRPIIDTLEGCTLDTFTPTFMADTTDSDVSDLLRRVPKLRKLTVRGWALSNELLLALTMDITTENHKNLCPDLQEIRWITRAGCLSFNSNVLKDMMCSRWRIRLSTIFSFAYTGVEDVAVEGHEEFLTMLERGAVVVYDFLSF